MEESCVGNGEGRAGLGSNPERRLFPKGGPTWASLTVWLLRWSGVPSPWSSAAPVKFSNELSLQVLHANPELNTLVQPQLDPLLVV